MIIFYKGIPISSQWNKKGHLYPVQISQFGLSHYSKWIESLNVKESEKKTEFKISDMIFKYLKNENKKIKIIPDGFEFNVRGNFIH